MNINAEIGRKVASQAFAPFSSFWNRLIIKTDKVRGINN
jgi:hypothetical protein